MILANNENTKIEESKLLYSVFPVLARVEVDRCSAVKSEFNQAVFNFLFFLSLLLACLTGGASISFASPKAHELLQRKGFVWKTAVTVHLRIHSEPGTLAEARIDELKQWQEKAYARNLQLLNLSTYSSLTDIFIVGSRERMKQLIGVETNGRAFPKTKVVIFVFSETIKAAGSHELMHVMAGNAWKGRPTFWLSEGFACYADDMWHGYRLHDLSKYLLQKKSLASLKELIENFGNYSDMVTYPQSGSFVKYLYEQYGVDKVKTLWKSGSAKALKRMTGKDISTIEQEWHGRLMEADATKVAYELPRNR